MGKFPRKINGYLCGCCGSAYKTEEDALECCPIEEAELWECVDCGEIYDDRDEAYNCCE